MLLKWTLIMIIHACGIADGARLVGCQDSHSLSRVYIDLYEVRLNLKLIFYCCVLHNFLDLFLIWSNFVDILIIVTKFAVVVDYVLFFLVVFNDVLDGEEIFVYFLKSGLERWS